MLAERGFAAGSTTRTTCRTCGNGGDAVGPTRLGRTLTAVNSQDDDAYRSRSLDRVASMPAALRLAKPISSSYFRPSFNRPGVAVVERLGDAGAGR